MRLIKNSDKYFSLIEFSDYLIQPEHTRLFRNVMRSKKWSIGNVAIILHIHHSLKRTQKQNVIKNAELF